MRRSAKVGEGVRRAARGGEGYRRRVKAGEGFRRCSNLVVGAVEHLGDRAEALLEQALVHDGGVHLGVGHGVELARRAVQQRLLAEVGAGSLLSDVLAVLEQGDGALAYEDEGDAGLALLKQELALLHVEVLEGVERVLALERRQVPEGVGWGWG